MRGTNTRISLLSLFLILERNGLYSQYVNLLNYYLQVNKKSIFLISQNTFFLTDMGGFEVGSTGQLRHFFVDTSHDFKFFLVNLFSIKVNLTLLLFFCKILYYLPLK